MASQVTINISLSPELQRFVDSRVESGQYASVSEVVRDALRLLEQKESAREEALRRLDEDIKLGLDQLERGEVRDGEEVFREIVELSQ